MAGVFGWGKREVVDVKAVAEPPAAPAPVIKCAECGWERAAATELGRRAEVLAAEIRSHWALIERGGDTVEMTLLLARVADECEGLVAGVERLRARGGGPRRAG